MHLVHAASHTMGTSAVVGTTIPHAVGYALALKHQRKDSVVVCFFGDGATEEGVYHESLNFASLKHAPVIFVCENNGYAIHTHVLRRQLSANLSERVHAYGIPAERIEDGDVLRIHERTQAMVEALRGGKPGPFFLECLTYRWKEHVGPSDDFHLGYRTKEEAEPWKKNDQVPRLAAMVEPATRQRIEAEVEAEIKEAFEFAENSPFPAVSELHTDVFKEN